jgi:nucleotide-binding universal stress UspA family protein
VSTDSDARAVPTTAVSSLKPVLAAVDGSAHSLSAVGWAADEATRTRRPLLLFTATNDFLPPVPHFSVADSFEFDGRIEALLKTLRDQLSTSHPDTPILTTVRPGTPIGAILEAQEGADVVVLGKRGLGAFARLIVGSTSIAMAGRSRLPAVIVPDTWDQQTHVNAPLVVGLDTDHYDDRVLRYAFERAERLSVPLVAVHAWMTHPVFTASQANQEAWAARAVDALEDLLAPSRKEFPEVDLRIKQRHAHPAMAVLDESESRNAQRVVLGRHTPSQHRGGFAIGSVTRAALHYADCPVVVVG